MEIDKHACLEATKEPILGFEVAHVCFVEVGDSAVSYSYLEFL